VSVHPLCLELMPDFQPTSEVMSSPPFHICFQSYSFSLIMTLSLFLQNIEPAPLDKTISYKIVGPISTLGHQSPTWAQLMSRYATLDTILISSASDKRKAPSLIAPLAAKRKRTSKKLLIQVRIPCLPECNAIL
jgi:hypothetical protein